MRKVVARGTVTQANCKISAVDGGATASGGAFIDFTAADVLTSKIGHLLRVKDSAGKVIQGWIKAAGTEESGDDDLAGFDFTSGWGTVGTVTIDDANSFTTTGAGGVTKANILSVSQGLYKVIYNGGTVSVRDANGTIIFVTAPGTAYRTNFASGSSATFYLRKAATGTIDVATLELHRILTPSATGITITSTKGGATYNWATKNSAFNYNDASGYTYELIRVNAVPVDSDSCTNANVTINLTDGSASFVDSTIDDSAYQDGRCVICVYDAAGKCAFGYYKSGGSGAIVNTKGGATQNWIYVAAGFSTAGNFTRKILYVGA